MATRVNPYTDYTHNPLPQGRTSFVGLLRSLGPQNLRISDKSLSRADFDILALALGNIRRACELNFGEESNVTKAAWALTEALQEELGG